MDGNNKHLGSSKARIHHAKLHLEQLEDRLVPAFAAGVTDPFGLTDVGFAAAPTFGDIDNDGDLDVFIGDDFGVINYFENTGTQTAPAFAANVNFPFGLTNAGGFVTPFLVDIDNDNDLDIFAGVDVGNTFYFENTGTALAPAFAAPVADPFGLADVGVNAASRFADIDGDGDFDAFIGNNSGMSYFENTGTATAPSFAAAVLNPFGLTDVGASNSPVLVDVNGDGLLDAFVGNGAGNTNYFQNTGTSTVPVFAAAVANPFGLTDVGNLSAPSFADIDADGDLDAFIGEGDGLTNYFEASSTIDVMGNGTSIANGDLTPTTADGTDFGSVTIGSSGAQSYQVNNTDAAIVLALRGAPTVTITGANPGDFVVTVAPTTDVAAGGFTTFTITFTPTATGLRTATVSIVNNDDTANPFTFALQGTGLEAPVVIVSGTNESFVTNLYADLLGRDPDQAGFEGWVALLDGGASRSEVVDGFLHSPEYFTRLVTGLYLGLLHREPDAEGLAGWVSFLLEGNSVEDVFSSMLASAEYADLHSSSSEFVTALYIDLFHRSPSAEEVESWTLSGQSNQVIIDSFLASPEYVTRRVEEFYVVYLRRAADPTGLAGFTADVLDGELSIAEVLGSILSSDEYFDLVPQAV